MRVARTWQLSLVSAVAVVSAQLMPLAAAHATSTPVVVVTTPATQGTTVEGITTVAGTGSVDPADTAQSMQLVVDGTPVSGSTQSCGVAQGADCSLSFSYDFSGVSGGHSVALKFTTTDVATPTVTSGTVGVNVTYTVPTAAVTSPAGGTFVTGPTSIGATGSTGTNQTDWPTSLALYVNGTLQASFPCPTPGLAHKVCSTTFSVDFTGLSGSQSLVVHMVTNTTAVDSPAPYAVNPTNPAPVVTITSPGNGTPQSGTVPIDTTGTVNASLNDNASQLQLFVDGTQYGASYSCPLAKSCTHTFFYDGTGRTDTANLVVKLLTTRGVLQPSPGVALNMSTPAPTASISSPTAGAGVNGVVHVVTTAAVGAGQTDNAQSLQLIVDGAPLGTPTSCAAATTCSKTLDWDASGVSGAHTLAVKFVTTGGIASSRTVTTTPFTVNVSSPGPSAAVLSPSFGTSVQGPVSVVGFGAVNASQSDTPGTLQLYVDGAPVGSPVATVPAADADPKHGQDTFSWDSTGLVGTHSLQVKFVTGNLVSVLSPSVAVTVTSPAPVVVLTSPAASATVGGVIAVTATATIDASQADTPASLQLYLDGAPSGSAFTCPSGGATPKVCNGSFPWDASGLTGTHVVQVRLGTTRGVFVLSTGASVTVSSPAPTVTITSPTVDSTVSGSVTVTATGQVNASQTDTAGVIQLVIDGTPQSFPQACSGADPKACPMSFTWATAGLFGPHTVAVSFTSAKGRVVLATERVYVFSGTTTRLSPIATLPYGHVVTVRGTLTATANGKGVGAALVDVTFTPAVGAKHTLTVRTDGLGRFSAGLKVASNTAVTAVPRSTTYFGPSSAAGKIRVTAGISCAAKVTVNRGAMAKGVCKVPNLLKGTKVTLQYKVGNRWLPVGSAKAGKASVSWSARFAKSGTYAVRVVVAASRVFAVSTSASSKLVVR